jgi:hypothetical protein
VNARDATNRLINKMYVSPELMRQYRPGSPWCFPFGVVQCSEVEAVQALDFRLSGPCDDVGGIEGLERCLPPANAELTLQLQKGLTWRLGCHAERAPEPRERRIAAASDTSARQGRQILLPFWHGNLSRRAAFPDRPRLRRSAKPAAILESWSESDADPCRSLSAARVVWQATGKAGMIFHQRRL